MNYNFIKGKNKVKEWRFFIIMSALHMNSEDFKKVVAEGNGAAVVDFWATWCGPCKMLGPTIEELADELEGQAVVGKVDVDENRELASQFGVMSIPTVVFFKDGKEVTRLVGVQSKEKLLETVNSL